MFYFVHKLLSLHLYPIKQLHGMLKLKPCGSSYDANDLTLFKQSKALALITTAQTSTSIDY